MMGKIKSSPLIAENTAGINVFLFLFLLSYFVVGADFSKDIADERGEFQGFCGILEESNTIDVLSYIDYLKTDQPVIGEASVFIQFIEDNDLASLTTNRGPPQIA